jgi:hypothetical protein
MARPDRESGADEGVRPALQRAQEGDQRGAIVGGQLQAEAVAGDGVGRGAGEPVRGAEGGKPDGGLAERIDCVSVTEHYLVDDAGHVTLSIDASAHAAFQDGAVRSPTLLTARALINHHDSESA